MNDHHLIMGQLNDYLTGQRLDDTHDERYRQKLARHLVEYCGFSKQDITARLNLTVTACGRQAVVPVDFLLSVAGQAGMLVKYGPGSLVTRHNPAIAVSRVIRPYQIPVVVVTNGENAHIIDSRTGKLTGEGVMNIPSKDILAARLKQHDFSAVSIKMVEMSNKIIYAFEVDDRCPCDTDICRLP
jgi:hypothetical protein